MSIGSPMRFHQNDSAHSHEMMLHPVFSGSASSHAHPATSAPPSVHASVFSCSITHGSRRVGIEIIGEIDRTSAGQFRNQLLTLAKEHPVAISIDMKHVALPDEAAVAVLLETWRFAQEHGIELAVTSPPPAVTDAFELAPSGQLLTLRT
jgi:anti-anti-sigma factor